MMVSITRMVAAVFVVVPLAIAHPAMALDQDTDATGPMIVHLDPATERPGGDVKVIHGSAVHPEPIARNSSSKAAPNGGIELVGGDTLWLVDRKASVLTGCFLAATIVAGDLRDIRCESARLR